jgi:hypothetical protein
MRYLRHEDIVARGIKYSKAHIWRLRKLPASDSRKFPDPVKGLGSEDAWTEPQIEEYEKRRIAAAGKRETVAA